MTSVAELVAEARRNIQNLSVEETYQELRSGEAILVDVREPNERTEDGIIPGSVAAPRGLLEFMADPESPYHREEFSPGRRIILHCAVGGRSALAAVALKQLGYTNVAHLEGGIKAWRESGKLVEQVQ